MGEVRGCSGQSAFPPLVCQLLNWWVGHGAGEPPRQKGSVERWAGSLQGYSYLREPLHIPIPFRLNLLNLEFRHCLLY